MEWQEWSKTLKDVLGMKSSPVAVNYSPEAAEGASEEGEHWVCEAWFKAGAGEVIDLTAQTCSCSGGSWHLGLTPPPSGEMAEALKKFLVEGEKLFASAAAFHRAGSSHPQPPLGLAEHVIFRPLETAPKEPDVVLFLCNPEQACRIITLYTYWSGLSPRVELTGSACYMAITYSLVSGEVNVSFLDWTARKMRKCPADILIVSVPYHHMPGIVSAVPRCTAGTAITEFPPEFKKLVGDVE